MSGLVAAGRLLLYLELNTDARLSSPSVASTTSTPEGGTTEPPRRRRHRDPGFPRPDPGFPRPDPQQRPPSGAHAWLDPEGHEGRA
eukprot:7367885-Pyramimonas_sp.AAC.1